MNIGIITYKKYDENVLLNAFFNADELFTIILKDEDFIRFEIFDCNKKLLASTNFPDVDGKGFYIHPVQVEREEELLWINYYAFRTPSTIRKTKVIWKVYGTPFRTKKLATEHATKMNTAIAREIEKFKD
ncbi:hypothetical protein LZQ00_08270 [Sphingobacterium sp. SRCM116780]|uniref:hypothetical protein n=1 Tax=Sphingobacterium sp. SRCM116780 TaxID=2907623 RepID=UPI001F450484|nr:hypothetical protein [Sphingobacterium sp. SRCM116780]UIR57802.1 hypothetical protein LZQ00_08270 [Sphingobacterium sp. SRCM116780]